MPWNTDRINGIASRCDTLPYTTVLIRHSAGLTIEVVSLEMIGLLPA